MWYLICVLFGVGFGVVVTGVSGLIYKCRGCKFVITNGKLIEEKVSLINKSNRIAANQGRVRKQVIAELRRIEQSLAESRRAVDEAKADLEGVTP